MECLMQHKTFEAWIFDDDELDEQDDKALRQHLQECDQCYELKKTWPKVETFLITAPQMAPAPGFVNRWQERLESPRRPRECKQTLALLAVTTEGWSGAVALCTVELRLQFTRSSNTCLGADASI